MLTTIERLDGSYLPASKKLYFASDFHLGVPSHRESLEREKKIVRWLSSIQDEAAVIFLLGDIFDFWFEYKYVIPKGFIRLQGKLAELSDSNIPVIIFTGNHDMWMFDYFTRELGIQVYHKPQSLQVKEKRIYLGHWDGLGPGDPQFKYLKKIFRSALSQRLFALLPPRLGMGIAHYWSANSRNKNHALDKQFLGEENEWIYRYCQQVEAQFHHDYYILGHRHLPLDMKINISSRYINLGEWISDFTYAVFDGNNLQLLRFEE
jgi:UDP-2,3-diacylglucosamine hydrolase